MGLDMYLTAQLFLWSDQKDLKQNIQQVCGVEEYLPQEVLFEVGYWRKANQIHKWFVDNVQHGKDDCGNYYVSNENLDKLKLEAETALKSDNPKEILPTQAGFFFGNTEYNEYYKQDLQDTIEIIEKWQKSPLKEKCDLYYESSW